MTDRLDKKAKVEGPKTGQVVVVTAGLASAATDLSAAAEFGNANFTGRMVTLIADAAVWYRWGPVTGTVDETATTGDNRCSLLPANVPIREYPGGVFFIHKRVGGADVRVRIHKSSH